MAKKVYAVKKGRETGLFTDWDTCKKQVDGFPGAEYRSFTDPQDALAYLGLANSGQTILTKSPTGDTSVSDDGRVRAYVDGSFDSATSAFACGVVILIPGSEPVELSKSYEDEDAAVHRNVAGEVMGATLAINYCQEHGIDKVTIYHDYEGISKWANDEWKANHLLTQRYKQFVATSRATMTIDFVKVKAHSGDKYNEIADKLAKKALGI